MLIYFNFLILISEIFYRWDDLNLNTNSLTDVLLKEEMKKTANELLDSMQDTRFSETEFLQFVDNLKNQNQLNCFNQLNSFIKVFKVTNDISGAQRNKALELNMNALYFKLFDTDV